MIKLREIYVVKMIGRWKRGIVSTLHSPSELIVKHVHVGVAI